MELNAQIALWGDRLRDMAAVGLIYDDNPYARERYEAMQGLAAEMLALVGGEPLAVLEPLRETLFLRPTPLVAGDGAVIDGTGRLLLIRRADNGRWALPGGALAVGETPAEGVAREVWEETGVCAEPVALVGVHDSRRCGTQSRFHIYHFLFLFRPLPRPQAPKPLHPHEVLEVGWFGEHELPSDWHPGHAGRVPLAFRTWRGERAAWFDREEP